MIDTKTSNEQLIELSKNNNEEAFSVLLFKWNGLISMLCLNYLKNAAKFGITFQELKSIAQYSVYNSLKYYDKNKSNFKTYLNMIVTQAIIKHIKKSEIRFYELSSCISLDESAYENSLIKFDEIIDDPSTSIVNWYNSNEEFEYFDSIDESILSKEDKTIMYLRASGYTYHEAAKKLKIPKNHTDFTLKKVKKISRK